MVRSDNGPVFTVFSLDRPHLPVPVPGLAPAEGWDYAHSLHSDNARTDTRSLPSDKVRRMPLHHAVLALLSAKPAHGYELKNSFEQAVGDQWGGLNIGHLYQILDRLSRDGLIDSQRQPQQVKPDRVIHRLTPAGRAELDRWLAEPAVPARGYRDDFFLKIMAAVRSGDPATLSAVLSRQRTHLLRQLHALADARAATSTTAVEALLITAAELHIRADLGVVDAAEKTLITDPATTDTGQASPGLTPPQTAAG
jgi:DNA-binding PadR family transcriptional regulator